MRTCEENSPKQGHFAANWKGEDEIISSNKLTLPGFKVLQNSEFGNKVTAVNRQGENYVFSSNKLTLPWTTVLQSLVENSP